MAWAASASSQRVGSSTRAFSSSSLRSAGSQSKTPPEQVDRLLDVGLGGLDIRSHAGTPDPEGGPIARPACQNKPSASSFFFGGGGGAGAVAGAGPAGVSGGSLL